ncbi:armadillo repeat kinesin 2 [Striga asiatica]|uniref:Armadillo repeat kinesin 2 n=1 Tax=Striga asiatica TaxID=4170 RepID=A0A5A7R3A5_STRAF|nr:armadillo repeat kinesin 2 [Striga asiatica]
MANGNRQMLSYVASSETYVGRIKHTWNGGRGSTSNLDPPVDGLQCLHRVQPDFLTSNTDTNPARRYHRCPHRNTHDAELPPFQKACFLKLKNQKNLLEEQLKCKDIVEKQLNEKLQIKKNKLQQLKKKIEELERKNHDQNKRIEELEWKNHDKNKEIEELERKNHQQNKKLNFERKFAMVLLLCVFLAMFKEVCYDATVMVALVLL